MGRIELPYQFREGNKAFAAQLMADLNTLAGGLNSIRIQGLPEGDLESTLQEIKGLLDGKIDAFRAGNADQIKFSDGDSFQEKLDSGALRGADAVVSSSDGMYHFFVGGDGHLYLVSRSQAQEDAFSIDERGHLIYSLGEADVSAGEATTYDLGSVKGPKGDGGDMLASVYDPSGKAQDLFAYADAAVSAAAGTQALSGFAYAAAWDGEQKNRVSVNGLKATDHFYVCHSSSATAAQRAAWRNGCIFVSGQEAGAFTLQADQTLPLVDIPLTVILLP